MFFKKKETPEQIIMREMSSIAEGALLLVNSLKMNEFEAIELSKTFYQSAKKNGGSRKLTPAQFHSFYISTLAEVIEEDIGVPVDLNNTNFDTEVATKLTDILIAQQGLGSLTGAIGNALNLSPDQSNELKESMYKQASPTKEVNSPDKPVKTNTPLGTLDNPILLNSAPRTLEYLEKLRTQEGSPICFHRVGSYSSTAVENPVDRYEILSLDNKVQSELHFSMYSLTYTSKTPPNFYLDESYGNDFGTTINGGFGSNFMVADFPNGLLGLLKQAYGDELGAAFQEKLKIKLLHTQEETTQAENNENPKADFSDLSPKTLRDEFVKLRTSVNKSTAENTDAIIQKLVKFEAEIQLIITLDQTFSEVKFSDKKLKYAAYINALISNAIGELHRKSRHLQAAIDSYDKALEKSSDFALTLQIRSSKAAIYKTFNKTDEELTELNLLIDKALKFKPSNDDYGLSSIRLKHLHDAYVRTAAIYKKAFDTHNFDKAYELLTKVIGEELDKLDEWRASQV